MDTVRIQSTAPEEQVRHAIAQAFAAHDPRVTEDRPGKLVVEIGSVGMAYLIGGFRKAMKMPMRITVTTNGGPTGTGVLAASSLGAPEVEPPEGWWAFGNRNRRTPNGFSSS